MSGHATVGQVRRGDLFRFRGKRIVWQVKNVEPDGVELERSDGRRAPTRWLCWREVGWELVRSPQRCSTDEAHCGHPDTTT